MVCMCGKKQQQAGGTKTRRRQNRQQAGSDTCMQTDRTDIITWTFGDCFCGLWHGWVVVRRDWTGRAGQAGASSLLSHMHTPLACLSSFLSSPSPFHSLPSPSFLFSLRISSPDPSLSECLPDARVCVCYSCSHVSLHSASFTKTPSRHPNQTPVPSS